MRSWDLRYCCIRVSGFWWISDCWLLWTILRGRVKISAFSLVILDPVMTTVSTYWPGGHPPPWTSHSVADQWRRVTWWWELVIKTSQSSDISDIMTKRSQSDLWFFQIFPTFREEWSSWQWLPPLLRLVQLVSLQVQTKSRRWNNPRIGSVHT